MAIAAFESLKAKSQQQRSSFLAAGTTPEFDFIHMGGSFDRIQHVEMVSLNLLFALVNSFA